MPGIGTPLTYLNGRNTTAPRDSLKQFTEELQLQGKALGNALTYTIGGFYYEQKPDGEQAGSSVVYCPPLYTGTAACQIGQNTYGTSQTSKALYAQAALDLGAVAPALEGLRLTGGYRYTWDNISGFSTGFAQQVDGINAKCNATAQIVPIATAATACRYEADLDSKASTWLIGLDYKVTPGVMMFGKVSRGYKSGGFNQLAVYPDTRTFEPETVTSYEAGVKSDFRIANIPFRLNATGYVLDYNNSQRAGADFNPLSGAGGSVVRNADAKIQGIELEASVRPVTGLEFGGNFSYTDAKYTRYEFVTPTGQFDCGGFANPGTKVDLTCLPFQYVAPYIWSAYANATVPVGNDMGEFNLFISYSHTSSQYTDGDSPVGTQPGAYLEGFGLLNLSLDWNNVAGSGFDIGVFATNLTNEEYRISNANVYDQLLYDTTLFGEPRMYGLRLKYRFGG